MRWFFRELPDVVVGAIILAFVFRDVTRRRLERFAWRQALLITVDNGPVVIDYLATTRRWRAGGFVAGLLVDAGIGFTQRSPWHPGGAGALIGWFVGAVVAEWRIDLRRSAGVRRMALLTARRLTDYLPRWLVVTPVAAWVGALVVGAGEVLHLRPTSLSALGELALAVVAGPVLWVVAGHVLQRPQPLAAPDVLAADDALRSRSLHVLAGSALAIVGFLAALIESAAQTRYDSWFPGEWGGAVIMVTAMGLPAIGWVAALAPFATRRSSPPVASGRAA